VVLDTPTQSLVSPQMVLGALRPNQTTRTGSCRQGDLLVGVGDRG